MEPSRSNDKLFIDERKVFKFKTFFSKNNTQHDTNNFSANKMVSFDDDDNWITEPPIVI